LHIATDEDLPKEWLVETWQRLHPNGGFVDKDNNGRSHPTTKHPADYVAKYASKGAGLPDPRLGIDLHGKKNYWVSRNLLLTRKDYKERRRIQDEVYSYGDQDGTFERRIAEAKEAAWIQRCQILEEDEPYREEQLEDKRAALRPVIDRAIETDAWVTVVDDLRKKKLGLRLARLLSVRRRLSEVADDIVCKLRHAERQWWDDTRNRSRDGGCLRMVDDERVGQPQRSDPVDAGCASPTDTIRDGPTSGERPEWIRGFIDEHWDDDAYRLRERCGRELVRRNR
jgi:hypothetical protein